MVAQSNSLFARSSVGPSEIVTRRTPEGWETEIVSGPLEGERFRFDSEAAAVEGHAGAVWLCRAAGGYR